MKRSGRSSGRSHCRQKTAAPSRNMAPRDRQGRATLCPALRQTLRPQKRPNPQLLGNNRPLTRNPSWNGGPWMKSAATSSTATSSKCVTEASPTGKHSIVAWRGGRRERQRAAPLRHRLRAPRGRHPPAAESGGAEMLIGGSPTLKRNFAENRGKPVQAGGIRHQGGCAGKLRQKGEKKNHRLPQQTARSPGFRRVSPERGTRGTPSLRKTSPNTPPGWRPSS